MFWFITKEHKCWYCSLMVSSFHLSSQNRIVELWNHLQHNMPIIPRSYFIRHINPSTIRIHMRHITGAYGHWQWSCQIRLTRGISILFKNFEHTFHEKGNILNSKIKYPKATRYFWLANILPFNKTFASLFSFLPHQRKFLADPSTRSRNRKGILRVCKAYLGMENMKNLTTSMLS